MNRRTVALGTAAALAVTAAVVVTVSGRSSESPKHKAVARYIEDVDGIQQSMQVPLLKSANAYRDFSSSGSIDKKLLPQLSAAERTLRSLQRRLVALPVPDPATHLRALLVQLLQAEVGVAGEVNRVAVFTPRYTALLRQSGAAAAVLSRALKAIKRPQAQQIKGTKAQIAAAHAALNAAAARAAVQQADAVEAYGAAIRGVRRRLKELQPPEVMRPTYRVQLKMLAASAAAGSALARELRKDVRSGLPELGRRFTETSRIAATVTAQQAEIAAVKAYNRRVRAIGKLQDRIRTELARLQRSL
jgi:hypothetical protein